MVHALSNGGLQQHTIGGQKDVGTTKAFWASYVLKDSEQAISRLPNDQLHTSQEVLRFKRLSTLNSLKLSCPFVAGAPLAITTLPPYPCPCKAYQDLASGKEMQG